MLLPATIAARVLNVNIPPSPFPDLDPTIGRLIEYAARTLAVERYPMDVTEYGDGGQDGCPSATVRHVEAGALVASLVTGMGFPYGSPPPADEDEFARVPTHLRRRDMDEDYLGAPHYSVAESIVEAFLGASSTRDPVGPDNDKTPEEVHAAAIDLAIELLCDPAPIAEVTAGAAGWMLAHYRGSWASARCRRMLSIVGGRTFPRAGGVTS